MRKKIIIVLAYRTPSDDINKFLDNMNPVLRSAMTTFNNVCFLGDFNMSNIDWETYSYNCAANSDFCAMINQNNLIQFNNVISNKHGDLLDLVFASSPSLITEPVECPILFETDHTVLSFNFNLTSNGVS